jgi:hypothetical protein
MRVARVGVKDRAAQVFVEHADPLTIRVAGYRIVVERRSALELFRGKRSLIVKIEIRFE